MALMALDHPEEALAAAKEAKDSGQGQGPGAVARCIRAEILSQAGKHEEAIAECQAMLKEYNQPGDVRDIRRRRCRSVYPAATQVRRDRKSSYN